MTSNDSPIELDKRLLSKTKKNKDEMNKEDRPSHTYWLYS
jgi:hypothetical protein